MRLGAPVFEQYTDPGQWVAALRRAGYRAAFCPVNNGQSDDVIQDYARAAEDADIVIAEVGAWSNPLSPDDETRRAALERCQNQLALAEKIGARCCVNISGSRGELWSGPHPDNLTDETFDLIVETVRKIVDAVKPTRTFYTLETMPWMYPDSTDSYLKLIKAIDRKQVAAHFDPVNLVCSPQRYYNNGKLIRDFIAKLGPHIRSCHAKDVILSDNPTVHLDETRPGKGELDYRVFLSELDKLAPSMPLMIEHLPNEAEYKLAAGYIRSIAEEVGVTV
ncbi:MAG: sugar phosphate isomerase/epimerase family protein [Candidatus Poribacteria bacterium]